MKHFPNNLSLITVVLIGYLIVLPAKTYAIVPPDFVFEVGSQLIQIFSVVFIFLSTLFASSFQFIKIFVKKISVPKWVWVLVFLGVAGISLVFAQMYSQSKQQSLRTTWDTESTEFDLEIETAIKKKNPDLEKNVVEEPPIDLNIKFINNFYSLLENQRLSEAYELSTKKFSYAIFEPLYINVEKIYINEITQLSEQSYQVELRIDENNEITNYSVTLNLGTKENGQIYIKSSNSAIVLNTNTPEEYNSIAISNQEFQQLLDGGKAPFVLDAREDEEYKIGYFPDSTHIRLADIKDGQWTDLPKDQTIYIFCWSGLRGKDVADFLITQGLDAIYIEEGASGWVKYGGNWIGEINFSSVYSKPQYSELLDYDDVLSNINDGAIVVDARESERFDYWHIPNSINISVISTPTEELDSALAQIPPNSKVITICDDVVNCFDARVIGVKIETRGSEFLGRYNKPWEYRNNM